MDISQVLYRIDNEDIEIIQEEITVQYDNMQQCPLGFSWNKKHFEVLDLYRVIKDESGNSNFMVLTTGGIYNLVLIRESRERGLSRSRWVLNYRVKEDDQPGLAEHSPVLLKGGSLLGTESGLFSRPPVSGTGSGLQGVSGREAGAWHK